MEVVTKLLALLLLINFFSSIAHSGKHHREPFDLNRGSTLIKVVHYKGLQSFPTKNFCHSAYKVDKPSVLIENLASKGIRSGKKSLYIAVL